MKHLLYKIIISDDSGAPIFQKLNPLWESAKHLDESYLGPEMYWAFYQLGDFDQIEVSLVKWEIWSIWRAKSYTEFNKGAFIGVTGGIFFFLPKNESSIKQLKESLEFFLTKRKSSVSPIIVMGILDREKKSIDSEMGEDKYREFEAYLAKKNVILKSIYKDEIEIKEQPWIHNIFKSLLSVMQPQLVQQLDIDSNFWQLPLSELRAILNANLQGIKLKPRHLPKLKPDIQKAAAVQINHSAKIGTLPTRIEELTPEQQEHVAISPSGEIIPIKKEITKEEVADLVKKGFKLPSWVVIPRHCPKCFNQNQKIIREVPDPNVILMESPRIFGIKYICGVCGHNWK